MNPLQILSICPINKEVTIDGQTMAAALRKAERDELGYFTPEELVIAQEKIKIEEAKDYPWFNVDENYRLRLLKAKVENTIKHSSIK